MAGYNGACTVIQIAKTMITAFPDNFQIPYLANYILCKITEVDKYDKYTT